MYQVWAKAMTEDTYKKMQRTVEPHHIARIQNIHLQLKYWIKMPPRTGPNAGPTMAMPWNSPTYLPLSAGVAMSPMQPAPVAIEGDPPVAWSARKTIKSQNADEGVRAIPIHETM